MNQDKKAIKSEDSSSGKGATEPSGVGTNFNTTWQHLSKKYGGVK
jgi:hypothetical protein